MNDLTTLTDADLLEAADHAEEYYGEVSSQNASERAMFGDSGPGSAASERRAYQSVAAYRNEIARRWPKPANGYGIDIHEDLPF